MLTKQELYTQEKCIKIREKKKELRKNKTATAIALILALTFTLSLIALPTGNAQTTSTKKTYPYIGAIPNPVNVGGEVLIHYGITDALPGVALGWQGITVTVTKPDGTTETLGPFRTDSTGGSGYVYRPSTVGNYTLQTNFPSQNYSNTSPVYLASTSEKLTLVVQEDPIPYYPAQPLPTEYWTRPIDSQLRSWYTVSGSWLESTPDNKYVPYNEGPESAHVLWTKPMITGGLVGGDVGMETSMNQGPVAFETGDAYQGKWGSRFIIAGMLIYTHHTSVRPLVYTAVDLRTGEVVWEKTFLEDRSISMAQTFYWQSYNYMGTYRYLWVTSTGVSNNWIAFDPFDGNMRINITNVPSGTTIVGERGEIYRYSISTGQGRMTLWNMSALISMEGSFLSPGVTTIDANISQSGSAGARAQRAYSLNFTFPTGLPGSVTRVYLKDRFIGARINSTAVDLWGISLKPGQEGQLLFQNTWNAPPEWAEGNLTTSGFAGGWVSWSLEDKVGIMYIKETREHYGFSLETGKYLWGPTEPQHYLDSIDDSVADVRNIAFGKFYSASVGGVVYCYDVQTGERLWKYEADDPYTEILWSNNWWLKPVAFTDGKAYFGHTEHSANMPFPRGAPFVCLNATTGEVIWRVNGMFRQTRWGGRAVMGDSVIATMDTYDQQVWAIGKGPSALTVSAPDMGVPFGSSVMIRGTVMDVSPGTKSDRLTLRFPNGVAAVSDASMSDWMLYVYKQFERPMSATGVEVTISVVDANGNYREIGKTTSSSDGVFTLAWAPDVPGKYNVYASFAGSAGYYPSSAETAFVVDEAIPPVQQPEFPAQIDYTMTIVGVGIAILIAVVVVGAVIMLMLRKRA